jgi:hypothetical protein
MEFRKIVERFKKYPGYLERGSGHLSKRFKCSKEDILRAKAEIRSLNKTEEIKPVKRILIFDVETAPMRAFVWSRWKQNIYLEQTISEWFMLSWSAKWLYSTETMSDVLTSSECLEEDDKRISESLWKLLDEADIVIAHNGNSFDIPKVNSRFIINGLKPTAPYNRIDTKIVASKQFGFSSNKLDALAGYFGIDVKIDTNFDLWKRCMLGDEEALKYMVEYNMKDVEILEEVYLKMRPYMKAHPNVSLFNDDTSKQCTCCGSRNISEIEGKLYYTSVGAYEMYRCNSCSGVSRGRKTIIEKSKNKNTLTNVGK